MRPVLIGRTLILFLGVVSTAHCRARRDPVAGAPAASPPAVPAAPALGGPYLLSASEAAAYRHGREREIALLRDAIAKHARLSLDTTTRLGAAAAGLPLDAYRLLVARVDSGLRLRAALPADSSGPARAEWAELDSLRVELTVLRSRLDALRGQTP